jgi:TolB-like protein/Tfp pilus assembly protein PilF
LEILDAVERISRDPAFARADRLRRFLRHAVARTLAGEADSLKEILLGREVFDRGPDFDPKADPIVRIDARRLRRKLSEYYEGAGSGDAIRILFNIGTYVPAFRRAAEAQPASKDLVVAVLPFRNLSVSLETEFFSEGLSETLLNAVAREANTRVIARNSAFQWGDESLDPATLRSKFAIQKIVKGNVQTFEEDCRIISQVIDTEHSTVGWSKEFRGDFKSWFDLQEEVCRYTLQALRGNPVERRRTAPVKADRTAYQLFLRARHEMAAGNPQRYGEGLKLFAAAVEHDSQLAPAWAGLAHVHAALALAGHSPMEMMQKAREYSLKALALNPDEPDGLVTLGLLRLFGEFNFTAALQAFTRVLDLYGEHVGARINRGLYCLAAKGDLEEAEAELRSIIEIDPLNIQAHVALGQILYFDHRFDEAIESFESVSRFSPEYAVAHFYTMLALLAKGDFVRALEAFEVQARLIPYPCIHEWAEAIRALVAGNQAAAIAIIDKMEAESAGNPLAASVIVDACVRAGEADRAIAWLELMFQARHFRLLHIQVDPAYDSLRGNARFQALARKVVAGPTDLK